MRALLVIFALFLPASLSSVQHAQETPETTEPAPTYIPYESVGGWNVIVDVEGDPSCFIMGSFKSGATLRFGVEHDKGGASAYAVVTDAKWSDIPPDHDFPIKITIDGAETDVIARSGTYGEPPSLTIRFDDAHLAQGFALGSSMTIEKDGAMLSKLQLATPANAMKTMVQCQHEVSLLVKAMQEEDGEDEDDDNVMGREVA